MKIWRFEKNKIAALKSLNIPSQEKTESQENNPSNNNSTNETLNHQQTQSESEAKNNEPSSKESQQESENNQENSQSTNDSSTEETTTQEEQTQSESETKGNESSSKESQQKNENTQENSQSTENLVPDNNKENIPQKRKGNFQKISPQKNTPEEIEEQGNQNDQENQDSKDQSLLDRKSKLERLKNALQNYSQKKQECELPKKQEESPENLDKREESSSKNSQEESQSKKESLDYNQESELLKELKEDLPPFKERSKNKGYSLDTNSNTELPDSLIRTIINKFLNQRFCKKSTDLNVRSHSLEKTNGFYKWEVKDIIVHLATNQLNKVLKDKYGYEYSSGKSEHIPLSFYFDLSGSMAKYTNMLAVIAIELLKNNVKVLIGFNEDVNIQIDRINSNITLEELAGIIKTAGQYGQYEEKEKIHRDSRITCKSINRPLDKFLIESHAEKCVVFSDFDPIKEVVRLSNFAEIYWFCFEKNFTRGDLENYCGFLYPVQTAQNILEGLTMVSEKRFEALVYLDNPKELQRRKK